MRYMLYINRNYTVKIESDFYWSKNKSEVSRILYFIICFSVCLETKYILRRSSMELKFISGEAHIKFSSRNGRFPSDASPVLMWSEVYQKHKWHQSGTSIPQYSYFLVLFFCNCDKVVYWNCLLIQLSAGDSNFFKEERKTTDCFSLKKSIIRLGELMMTFKIPALLIQCHHQFV